MATRKRMLTLDPAAELRDHAVLSQRAKFNSTLDIYPLDAPGMPPIGPNYLMHASNVGGRTMRADEFDNIDEADGQPVNVNTAEANDEVLYDLIRRSLREPGFSMPIVTKPGMRETVSFVPGHIWGQYMPEFCRGQFIPVTGPQAADVMVIGKMPGKTELQAGRCLVGESGKTLISVLRELHIPNTSRWYVTNLLKFGPPEGSSTIRKAWINDSLYLLHQELRLVQPKYILCLGADASKALLGTKYSVSYMDGRVAELKFPVNAVQPSGETRMIEHTALVMSVIHPVMVSRAPDIRRQLERGLARFGLLVNGTRFDKEEKDIDHRTIRTLEELQALFYEIDHDPEKTDKWIGVDAEWHGEHPANKGSYIRTLQFAWRPKHAAALVWSDTQGQCAFFDANGNDARPQAVQLINQFFKDKRVVGHFLVADLEWLMHAGMHQILKSFRVPIYDVVFDALPDYRQVEYRTLGFAEGDIIPAWVRTHFEGGWDTGLAGHAIEETAQLGLEVLTMRYTSVPRYDIPLYEWKEAYCKQKGIKAKDLEGYGPCPDEVILPYGIYDADATLRLAYEQMPLIDSDYHGNCCREPFWEAMVTASPILEMHRNGVCIDKKRIDYLTTVFVTARASQEKLIQDWAKWPDFNIRSVQQAREFLFGERLNGKRDKDGNIVRLRPPDGLSLFLEPVLDTSKPPRQWQEIKERGEVDKATPGTGKMILGILANDNPEQFKQIQWLRDFRFLDQVLKSVLRPPKTDEKGNILMAEDELEPATVDDIGVSTAAITSYRDNMGGMIYEAGLASVMCDDGRVRTHLYPTTETGRWRSARPNLQNLSKRRDDDYKRILGGDVYKYKIRSIMRASPGHVLIEADYKSAELFCMAIMSGDVHLLEHCRRNQLPESDPDYYDIHSNVAVRAFNLKCPPTKKGLKEIGKSALRVAAKNVIFGVAYGRGAKAIALQCKEEGNAITVEEAEAIIAAVFEMYSGLVPFFEACRGRVTNPGWMCNCFGRMRRFPVTDDRQLIAEFERQAMNFPIQSMVASAMDRAVAYLQDYRSGVIRDPSVYRMLLQIHDAIVVEAPYEHAAYVAQHVLPHNMTERVAIHPTDLDGVPTGVGPYHLGVDVEVYDHWGESLTKAFCENNKIPLEFAGH